jgi:hypothetical protein
MRIAICWFSNFGIRLTSSVLCAAPISCTFEQAEERNLSAGINASTRAKVEFFEDMIEIGFKFGALKPNGPITWEQC